jgi:hypothetical protein
MTSLENRLQDTETALYATLCALETQGNVGSWPLDNTNGGCEMIIKPQRSKLEKQNEWKQQPLQKNEDIIAWFEERRAAHNRLKVPALSQNLAEEQPSDAEPSTTFLVPSSKGEPARRHAHQPPNPPQLDIEERLRSCRQPTVPNGSSLIASSTSWLSRYF